MVCAILVSVQDGSVLQTVVTGLGSVVCTTWIPNVGVTACSGRSKVRELHLCHVLAVSVCHDDGGHLTHVLCLAQDVLLIRCTPEWISQNQILSSCRSVLRSQGILGLNRAPCMAVLLERLPILLQEQFNYERVSSARPTPPQTRP